MSLTAAHPRTRERFMALYEICLGKSATRVGQDTQRNRQTIMNWVHRYNNNGPDALNFRRTGGHPPRISEVIPLEYLYRVHISYLLFIVQVLELI